MNLDAATGQHPLLELLVVDDDDGLCRLIEKKLQGVIAVSRCSTGAAAVETCREESNVLLLLDYKLPDMTAAEVVDSINTSGLKVPFIIMTGNGDERIAVEMMKRGARDYLIKDTSFIEFLPSVVLGVAKELQTETRLRQAEESIQKIEEAFHYVAEGTSSVVGQEFFQSLTKCLAHALKMKHAFVALSQGAPPARAKTLSFWNGRSFIENFEYDLGDTPCANALSEGFCIYPDDVQGKFPNDGRLATLDAESYIGIALCDSHGNTIGYVAVLDILPLVDQDLKTQVVKIFAARATAELQRVITEEEKLNLEEQLFQAQKMESIGRMAGGLAHDFNNILTTIMGYAELLKMKYGDTDSQEGIASGIILDEASKAAEITYQLLGFARKTKFLPEPLNANNVIRNVLKVSERLFEKRITVEYDLADDLRAVEADKNQLHQVLTNLVINARDAMPSGGRLTVKSENILKTPGLPDGKYIKISIADTGVGISKDQIEHIFEPFYTTKTEGKGTGLGLAMVYGIIENHDGKIFASSTPNVKTSFEIYLPASEKIPVERSPSAGVKEGSGTILIVDDEDHIRQLGKLMLEKIGYKVLCAKDGLEAIELYSKRKDDIDIVLLDMIMPRITGKDTFLRLKGISPSVKVLFISGFSQVENIQDVVNMGARGFMQKPFHLNELSSAVSEALNV